MVNSKVNDTVEGFIAIANSDQLIGQDCNIATNSEITIGNLARKLVEQINPLAKIVADGERLRPSKSEVFRLFGDNSKILQYTDWKPEFTLDKGLESTIKWFRDKENLKQYKADIYNV